MIMISVFKVFVASLLASQAVALYFLISETERKCFVEEIPDQTMVIGNYKVSAYDPQTKKYSQLAGLGMHVEVTDPDGHVMLSRLYTNEGRVTFTSSKPGEHVICLFSNSTRWVSGTMLRVDFNVQVGDHAQDYAKIAVKERLNDLQLRIRQLIDQVDQMSKEQNYQRYREEMFRQLSESTNQRVLWWAIAQTAVLILTGIWQMRHLKGFFEAKKLV
ncbi:EMP24 GP25L domain containing protein [Trichuris trichiura]|uniref:EMP24 GP25L domain containing protein n=1 Tax=Trichuris trichiura TaxID=36087 RepID=A0A077ZFF4_TRITR|nr:EMP24 GP25L domain containing protein [Trichuris trichiura]